jgi:prophage regulatory protein
MSSRPDRMVRWPEVRELTGISRTTAWREIRGGRFPNPVKLTTHSVAWRQSEIESWIASRSSTRRIEGGA